MSERHSEGKFNGIISFESRGRRDLPLVGEKRREKWKAVPRKRGGGGTVTATSQNEIALLQQVGIRTPAPHTPKGNIEQRPLKLQFPTIEGFQTARRAMREAFPRR